MTWSPSRAPRETTHGFGKDDSFVGSGYVHEYEVERDGRSVIKEEFVAGKIGHNVLRTTFWHRHDALNWELSALHTHFLACSDETASMSAPIAWMRDFAEARHRLREWVSICGTRLDRGPVWSKDTANSSHPYGNASCQSTAPSAAN